MNPRRGLSVLLAVLGLVAGCLGPAPKDQTWAGSLTLDADESRTSVDCDIHRVAHIEGTLECPPDSALESRVASMRGCRGAGSARYTYNLQIGGGTERATGVGEYRGELRGALTFFADPGYEFTLDVLVAGTYEGVRGTQRTGGPESRKLSAVIFFGDSSPVSGRSIRFDGDQKLSMEGQDCAAAALTGKRHMVLSLAGREPSSGEAARTSPSSFPLPTLRSAAPTVGRSGLPLPSTLMPFERTEVAVGGDPLAVAVNPVSRRAYVANARSNTVSVVDPSAERVLATVPVGSRPEHVAVDAEANRVYVVNSNERSVSVIDGASNDVLITIRVDARPTGIAIDPGRSLLFVASNETANLTVIDARTNQVKGTVKVGRAPVGVAVNTVTGRVYVANYGDGTVSVLDGPTQTVTKTVNLAGSGGGTNNVAISGRTGKIYVTDNSHRRVWVLDPSTSEVVATIDVAAEPWDIVASSTTGRIYVAHSGGGLTVINGDTDQVIGTYPTDPSYGVAILDATEQVLVTRYGFGGLSLLRAAR